MSYILDALRRADAERQRGAVPGLNAHPSPLPPSAAAAGARGVPFGWVLAGGALLLAIGLAVWLLGRGDGPPPPVSAAAAPAVPPVAAVAPSAPSMAVAPPAVAAAPPAPAPVVTPLAVGPTTVTVTVTGPAVIPASPPGRVAEAGVAAGVRQAGPKASSPAAVSASATPPAGAEPPPAASRVPPLAELPEDVRRQLPPLALGGGTYSDRAAQRLVIVNGQVAHEGDQPTAGLRVVQIRPRSVVFSFGGQLFEMGL